MAITKVTSGLISADASSIDLNIDAGTLYLDVSENRVGIGTTSPDRKLHINESASGTSNFIHLTTADTGTSGSNGFLVGIGSAGNAELWNYEAQPILFATSSTERMRIDSSGNVAIGATPKAYYSDYKAIDINNSASVMGYTGNNGAWLMENLYIGTDNNWKHKNSDFSALVEMYDGVFNFYNTASGTAGATATLQNRLTINQSGNCGIGTTSPQQKLVVGDGVDTEVISIFAGSGAASGIHFTDTNTSGDDFQGFVTYAHPDDALRFGTAETERMRIDSSGNVGIGTSSQSGVRLYVDAPDATHASVFTNTQANFAPIVVDNTAASGTRNFISFRINNTEVGKITSTGSSTTYATTSDYRLKENVDYEFNALDRVAQLKPARFNFIADADTTVDGFLAHEVQDIVPEAITGEKDGVREEEYEVTPAVLDDDGNVVTESVMGTREVPEYQGIDQSKLVPLLTKAIQELSDKVDNQQTIIDNLTTRIETLENA